MRPENHRLKAAARSSTTPKLLLWALALGCPALVSAQVYLISVHDTAVKNGITPYMTGACIEDVNHELYGGIYSQMIFGESFQEPAAIQLNGFLAYGGNWTLSGSQLSVADAGSIGPKIILDNSSCTNGQAGVDVNLGSNAGPSGLIIKVSQPKTGADTWYGYEVALSTTFVRIAKHENNYTDLIDAPYSASINQWLTLSVKFTGTSLVVYVNSDSVAAYSGTDSALTTGSIGLRAWSSGTTLFRNFWVNTSGSVANIAFTQTGGGVSGMWGALQSGSATGQFGMDSLSPFKGVQSQKITFTSGSGEIGIENQGLNRQGMNFAGNSQYNGYIWVRAPQPVNVCLALENLNSGAVFADTTMPVGGTAWERLNFTLTPSATGAVNPGRFTISLKQPGSITVGHVFLQPGVWGQFDSLPVRRDVANGLIAQKLTVLRLGGSMVNDTAYRWKNQIGPRDLRPMTAGTWYPYSSMGWGIFDFLNFCEKAGFLGIPDFNYHEKAQDMADFVRYANGPSTSTWGAKRAADGHPAPYNVKYVEIGNEETINSAYYNAFQAIADSMWAQDTGIVLIVGDFGYSNVITNPFSFTGAWSGITTLAAHQQILNLAKANNRAVWFDIHINTSAPPDPTDIPAIASFYQQLGAVCPGANYSLVNFELNSSVHTLARALANAHAINMLERMGNQVSICCSANCLQVDGQNDNGWDQGLLFLNPQTTWPQPPYFVTQMAAGNYLPLCLSASMSGTPDSNFDITATKSGNGQELAIQALNMTGQQVRSRIGFDRFAAAGKPVAVTTLTGASAAVNTAANPTGVIPVTTTKTATASDTFSFPANSYTVIHYKAPVAANTSDKKQEPPFSVSYLRQGIRISLDRPAAGGGFSVSIFDVKGSLVKKLIVPNACPPAKTVFLWEGKTGQGSMAADGSYIVSIADAKGKIASFRVMVNSR